MYSHEEEKNAINDFNSSKQMSTAINAHWLVYRKTDEPGSNFSTMQKSFCHFLVAKNRIVRLISVYVKHI
jgi:hypothetical protein